jgi:hypothetical protein
MMAGQGLELLYPGITDCILEELNKKKNAKQIYATVKTKFGYASQQETFRKLLRRYRQMVYLEQDRGKKCDEVPVGIPRKNGKATAFSEADIRQRHDHDYRLEQAVRSLKKGEYYLEADFRDHVAQVPSSQFRRYAERTKYDEYKGRAKGCTYWGHPRSIEQLKKDGVLI